MLKRSFLFNLLLVLLVIAGLLFAFFQSLNWLTNHGLETQVPKLVGKNMKDAIKQLKAQGFTIVIDSTYQSYKNPHEVIFQEPESGAIVKKGRTIFLTVNRKSVPTIAMPNLVSLSFRNALLTMSSYRLIMGDTLYRPDIAAGSVLEQWVNGKQISPGQPVPYGSKVTLVIGEGLSGIQDVPNLIGVKWSDAKATIESLFLSYNILWDGTITDSLNAVVYKQVPEALNELDFKNSIPSGDMIDVYIMQNPSAELLEQNRPGSSKLIGDDTSISQVIEEVPAHRIDTTPKVKRPIPGVSAPNVTTSLKKENKTDLNTKKTKETVKQSTNEKPKPKPKPSNVNEKKNTEIKSSKDAISNEYE